MSRHLFFGLQAGLYAAALMSMADSSGPGPSGKTILVHKQDAEGSITIDAYSGVLTGPLDERPEWAEGLAAANLAERHGFYMKRLGSENYTDEMRFPQAFAFEDLSFVGVDEDGEPVELPADDEFRMEAIATITGIERGEEELSGTLGETTTGSGGGRFTTTAVHDIDLEAARSSEEFGALVEAQEKGFSEDRKTANG